MKRPAFVQFLLLAAGLPGFLLVEPALAAEATKLPPAVQPYVEKQELAGAVMLVADKDKVLDCETVGYADVGAKKPMEKDSLFWIASQSKPITATALMMLVDEGKVNVDDPVEKYLPEFKGQMVVAERDAEHVLLKKPRHPITIENILSHTSGLPARSPIEIPTLDRLPLADRVRSYAMLPLDFEPDSKYQYSNAGINTAARIIEVVTGQPFEQFLDERLFRPLGMKDTTFWPTSEQVARLAKSYKPGPGNKGLQETTITQLHYPLTDRAERYPMPAGGLFSTAADLARFYQMILNRGQLNGRRYVSEKAVEQMTTRQTPPNLQQSYGFGFQTGGNTIGHGGAYSTNSHIEKDRGLILIWLVQHAGFPGGGKTAQDAFRRAALEDVKASVQGMVTLDGRRVANAQIVFRSLDGPVVRESSDIRDGAYKLKLPPGNYRIELSAQMIGTRQEKGLPAREEKLKQATEIFPERYNTDSTLTANVKLGTNNINLDLSGAK